jgi:hypothetical protein
VPPASPLRGARTERAGAQRGLHGLSTGLAHSSQVPGTYVLVSPRRDHTATLVRGKVLVTGGYNPQTGIQYSSELYDLKTGWSGFSASLNEDRYKHTATQIDANTVLIVGGFSNRDPSATTAELYSFP